MSDKKSSALEELLAHHDRQIGDLSEMVTRQWQEIDVLKKRMAHLGDKLSAVENSATDEDKPLSIADQAARDKPPHY